MTPYEITLYIRGADKRDYQETVRTVSSSYLNAALQRQKRLKPLKDFLPKEPLTKLEQSAKLWDSVMGLAAAGVGKIKVRKKDKK